MRYNARALQRQSQKAADEMTEREMFEKSFQRPTNFYDLPAEEQWAIDKNLGILDWNAEGLTDEDKRRYAAHYKQKPLNELIAQVHGRNLNAKVK